MNKGKKKRSKETKTNQIDADQIKQNEPEKKKKAPRNVLELIWMIVVGFVKGIPRLIKRTFIRLLIIFVVVLVINTYLVVVKNEGFSPTAGNKFLDITALRGKLGWATTFWTFGMFFVTNIILRIKKDGFKKFSVEVFGSPKFLVDKFKASHKTGLPTLTVTTGILLLIMIPIKSRTSLLLFFLIALLSFTKRENSFLLYFFSLLRNDLKNITKSTKEINPASLYIMAFSVGVAFLLAYLLQNPLIIAGLAIVLLGVTIFTKVKNTPAKAAAFFLMSVGLNAIIYKLTGTVFADDGGWQESGGTLMGWIGSDGALTAVGMGLAPGAGAAVGSILGQTFINADGDIAIISPEDLFKDPEELDTDIDTDLDIDPEVDAVTDIDGNGEVDKDGNPIKPPKTDEVKPTTDDPDKIEPLDANQKDMLDLLTNILGTDATPAMLTEIVEQGNDLKDFMSQVIKNGDYDMFTGSPKDRLEAIKKQFAGLKVDKVKALESYVKGGLSFLGGIFDTIENSNAGDDMLTAISKGMATMGSTFLLGEAMSATSMMASASGISMGAQFGLWELGNHILFGGSKMSDIASPGKMIKGGMNWALDAAGGMSEADITKRMNSGYYGENVKNLYHSIDMGKDFYNDPGKFYSELGDFTTGGGQGWKDMNNTADQIFALPKDVNANTKNLYSTDAWETIKAHPLDSTRALATDAAHLAVKGALKVGEGWAYIGEGAGTLSIEIENGIASAAQSAGEFSVEVEQAAYSAANTLENGIASAAQSAGELSVELEQSASNAAAWVKSWF